MDCRASLDTVERTEIAWPTSKQTLIRQLSSPELSCYTKWVIPAPMAHIREPDSIGHIVTGYVLASRGVRVRVPVGSINFLFSMLSRPALGSTQRPIQWVPEAFSLWVKRPGCEADHSPPSSAEVKKNVDLHIHSPICLMAQCLN
jgi:hypothetical protein